MTLPAVLRRASSILAVLAALSVGGCRRHAAAPADCRAVLDRLVELELRESGFHDAALAARWKRELGRRFAADLDRCRGLRVRDDLGACLARAQDSEQITHGCL